MIGTYIRPLWVAILICAISASAAVAAEFYVSPDGNDTNPGTKQKPFATLVRARDAVRRFKKAHTKQDITVLLRGGIYRLTETVVFTLEDSGGPGQTITYAAYPGEKPVLSAGVPIKKWGKLTDYPGELPEVARGKVWIADVSFIRESKQKQKSSPTIATQIDRIQRFYTLYDGNSRLQRARGKAFFLEKRVGLNLDDHRTFAFQKGMIRNWPDVSEAEVVIIPRRRWICNILPIGKIDEEKSIARTSVPATYRLQPSGKGDTQVENAPALLDEPGEWVLDGQNDKLYLWPLGSEPDDNIIAPVLTELIRVEGGIDYNDPKDMPVKNLVFRGLTFMHGDRFPWHGRTGWGVQHDWERFDSPSAMVRFRGAENCVVENCHFTTAGCTGLRFDLYAQKNRMVGNHFERLGGVGILLAGYGPGTKDVNRKNEISNNLIHNIGQLYRGSPGIFAWQSGENRIAHNHIHDLPYTGICVTGRIVWDPSGVEECSRTIRWHEVQRDKDTWSYAKRAATWYQREKYLHSRNNLVFRNDIHDVMQVCGDGNCIYISGAGAGNLVLENYCHDCPSKNMNNVIRCDDDQNETVIKRNIIHRTGGYAEGLLIKGRNDLIENFLVDLRTGSRHRGYLRFYSGNVKGSIIQRNVFYSCGEGQNVCCDAPDRKGKPGPKLRDTNADYNLYYSTVYPEWGKRHILTYQKYGIELHSVLADPLFCDVDKGDFRFKPDSPALKLGIRQPISIDEVGLEPMYRERWNHK